MTDTSSEANWLRDGKSNLLQLRQELWLSEAEIVIVDRCITALDRVLSNFQFDEAVRSSTPRP
jgi:hypothetical protein